MQIAKAYGAEVTGVCSTRNVDMVRSIGADHFVDYTREDFVEGGESYDLILDMVGNRTLSDCRRALSPKGTLVLVGGGQRSMARGCRSDSQGRPDVAVHQPKAGGAHLEGNQSDLIALKDLFESRKLKPVIDRTYPLTAVSEAIEYLETAHTRGKVVITI